jgi:hypothetical protein
MRSSLSIARVLGPLGVALFAVAGSASRVAAKQAGDPKDGDPAERKRFVWSKTREVFEFVAPKAGDAEDPKTPKWPLGPKDPEDKDTKDGDPEDKDPEDNTGRLTRQELMLRIRRMAEDRAIKAEDLLAEGQYSKVVESTAEALTKIQEVQLPAPALTEKLSRAHETARRMKERAEIEKEFRDLQIKIGGVAWNRTSPVALINGEIMRPGETVGGARIEEIRRSEVVFSLKGVRVRRISGTAPAE